jgi:hypothetical protein
MEEQHFASENQLQLSDVYGYKGYNKTPLFDTSA